MSILIKALEYIYKLTNHLKLGYLITFMKYIDTLKIVCTYHITRPWASAPEPTFSSLPNLIDKLHTQKTYSKLDDKVYNM